MEHRRAGQKGTVRMTRQILTLVCAASLAAMASGRLAHGKPRERFRTDCGWCEVQRSQAGGVCVGFCGGKGSSVACKAVVPEGEAPAQSPRTDKVSDLGEVWIRIEGKAPRVSDLARMLQSLTMWDVIVPEGLETEVLRPTRFRAKRGELPARMFRLASGGRVLRIEQDDKGKKFEMRAEELTETKARP